jgi:mRNA guanylyltransferase
MEWSSCLGFDTWKLMDETIKQRIMRQVRVWWGVGPNTTHFPGPQPVSIERKDLSRIKRENYWVCVKSDGFRYLLVFLRIENNNYTVLINRKQDMYLLDMQTVESAFEGTVLDGELVNNGREFMVYDTTVVCGRSVVNEPHSVRLAASMCVVDFVRDSGVDVQTKLFYPARDMKQYVDYVTPTITHGIDGYIFTPEDCGVRSGTHFGMFKWKEQYKNTVDFHVTPRGEVSISRGRHLHRLPIGVELGNGITTADLPAIVESRFVNKNKWEALLIRKDKTYPNNELTYTKTLLNIQENIQMEELCQ